MMPPAVTFFSSMTWWRQTQQESSARLQALHSQPPRVLRPRRRAFTRTRSPTGTTLLYCTRTWASERRVGDTHGQRAQRQSRQGSSTLPLRTLEGRASPAATTLHACTRAWSAERAGAGSAAARVRVSSGTRQAAPGCCARPLPQPPARTTPGPASLTATSGAEARRYAPPLTSRGSAKFPAPPERVCLPPGPREAVVSARIRVLDPLGRWSPAAWARRRVLLDAPGLCCWDSAAACARRAAAMANEPCAYYKTALPLWLCEFIIGAGRTAAQSCPPAGDALPLAPTAPAAASCVASPGPCRVRPPWHRPACVPGQHLTPFHVGPSPP